MTILPTNITYIEEISIYDSNGAIIYIFVVLIWYAIGFGLILIEDINPQPDRIAKHSYVGIYQTVSDLHEQQTRNEILIELKDKDRRMKLWQIYYGTTKNHPVTIQNDKKAVKLITKQLQELNQRRRILRHTLNAISTDQDDNVVVDDDDEQHRASSDNESYYVSNRVNNKNSKSMEQFKSYFK